MIMGTKDGASARTLSQGAVAKGKLPEMIISADGHACEPVEIWNAVPAKIRERMPAFHGRNRRPEGGYNPKLRLTEMDKDHISAEVLYPDTGLNLFRGDADVQEATFRVYNDWLADYCKTDPKRLFGI